MLHATPLAVIVPPPSLEIFPPLDAVVCVIALTAVVVNVGKTTPGAAEVVKETSLP